MPLGNLQPGNAYYQASGESTPQPPMPQKFLSTPPPTSSVAGQNKPPVQAINPHTAPIVRRAERKRGMRYLYALGHKTMPVHPLGANTEGPMPFISAFQPMLHGPIHNAGFNDALYQAGYPGYNLGLSFMVPTLPQNITVPTRGVQKSFNITQKLTRVNRATTGPIGA